MPLLRTSNPHIPVAISSVVNQALDRDPTRRFQRAGELAEAFAQASFGARGTRGAYNGQGAVDLNATQLERPSGLMGRAQSTGSWQFSPPILTGKLEAIPGQSSGNAAPPQSAKPAPGKADSRRLQPPVVTDNLPGAQTSRQTDGYVERVRPAPPMDDRIYEIPKPAAKPSSRNSRPQPPQSMPGISSKDQEAAAAAWWSQPQEPVLLGNEAANWDRQADYGYGQPYEDQVPVRRQRTSDKRGRGGRSSMKPGRRKVVALLAAGGVAVIGGGLLVNANRNTTQMANQALKSNTTQGVNVPMTGGTGNKANAAGQKATNGTVIGSTKQAKNTAVAFMNPADQKDSLLMHLTTGTFTAFERACTHEQVNVNYDMGTHTLVCPAHGAIFDAATGAVIQGPATKAIPKVTVRVNTDGSITV
jgi:nitrite reductase/ring-hydroxylating ferredoxin subunit